MKRGKISIFFARVALPVRSRLHFEFVLCYHLLWQLHLQHFLLKPAVLLGAKDVFTNGLSFSHKAKLFTQAVSQSAPWASEPRYRCRHMLQCEICYIFGVRSQPERAIWNPPLHMAIVSNSGHRGMRYSAFCFHSWNARCDWLCFPSQSAANTIIVVACSWGLVHKCNFGATPCWPFICMFFQSCVMAVLEQLDCKACLSPPFCWLGCQKEAARRLHHLRGQLGTLLFSA